MSKRRFAIFESKFLEDPDVCPHCKEDTVEVCDIDSVIADPDNVEVNVRCGNCGLTWSVVYEPQMVCINSIKKGGRKVGQYSYK